VLVLERAERMLDLVVSDAGDAEVVADERVARPSIGEHSGSTLGEARVVEKPRSPKSLECRLARIGFYAALVERMVDLDDTPVSVAQQTQRELDCRVRPFECRLSSRRRPLPRGRPRPPLRGRPAMGGVAPR
jgi:hypothetical protein